MRPLTPQRALDAWERGQRSDALGQTMALLAAGLPGVSREKLARLTLGQRDALLMRLRERTLSSRVKCFSQCPKCGVRLEFPLDLRAYDVGGTLERRLAPETLAVDGYTVRFRVPDSLDLDTMAQCPDIDTARGMALARCVLGADKDGVPVAPWELPEPVIEAVAQKMEELDPLAYLSLAIDCARCSHQWLVLLDIGGLFWQEVAASAERLLSDVHTLALAYGWSESEILGMSEARRKFYLQQIPPPPAQGKRL